MAANQTLYFPASLADKKDLKILETRSKWTLLGGVSEKLLKNVLTHRLETILPPYLLHSPPSFLKCGCDDWRGGCHLVVLRQP